ncbi:peptide ABC transporter substrate-binding protein [Pedomonas sp. V897]|uniref:peptide ABC transporter substrate-binding protein n=1 Tax=Pedomonas sp. V897 TaxID=3446482 RepID=UPI003EE27AA9
MMLRRLLLALLAVAVLAGCRGKPSETEQEHNLRVTVLGVLSTTDPHQAETTPERILAGETHLGLVTVDPSGQIVPGLAESWWVSEDGLSYIFRLRTVQWADGKPLTPEDVVASFRRMLSPQTRHPLAKWLARIRNGEAVLQKRMPARELGVRALTDTVVEITLEQPQPAFLALLAEPSVAIVRQVKNQNQTTLLGLGPYRIETQTDQHLTLLANEQTVLGARPAYGRLVIDAVTDPLDAIRRFREKQTDVVMGGATSGLAEARSVPNPATVRLEPTFGVYGYVIQTAKGPLADVGLRRALNMTIDRAGLSRQMFNIPAMVPVEGLVPPGFSGYGEPALPSWAYWSMEQRLTEARRLVTEAGYGPDKPLRMTVLLPPAPEHQKILAVLANGWAPLGVEVAATVAPVTTYETMAKSGDFDLTLRPLMLPIDQPAVFLAPYQCDAPENVGGFCVPEADQLMRDASSADDPAARTELLKSAEQLLVEEAPSIPLFVPVRWSLVSETVSGWTDNAAGRHPLAALKPQTKR